MRRPEGLYEAAGRRRGEERLLIAIGLIGLAMALILGAFFVGRAVSDGVGDTEEASAEQRLEGASKVRANTLAEAAIGGAPPAARKKPDSNTSEPKKSKRKTGRLTGRAYRGPVAAVTPRVVRASCQSADSVDAGGHKVSYSPMNTIDGRARTAWRCDGNGRGVTVRFELGAKQRIAAVGIIPGYAKTDPVNGVDRYRENRRIKRVRWGFDGGRFVVQRFDHGPGNRSLQKMRIPAVRTDTITLRILGSTRASRNTVAISRAWFASPR